MKDFVMAALPWVLMGLALAIWAASAAKKARKRKEDSKEGDNAIPKEEREMKEAESDYSTEGMCVGMCIGVIIWNLFELAYGLGLGMLIGLTVGSLIKKEKSNREH